MCMSYTIGELVGAPGRVAVKRWASPWRPVTYTYEMVSGVCMSDTDESVVSVFVDDKIIRYPTHMLIGFDDITHENKQHTAGHLQEWMQAWL